MGKKTLILSALLFAFFNKSAAQGYAGTEFWLALMDSDGCLPIPPPIPVTKAMPTYYYDTTELYLSSPYAATVIVHMEAQKYGDNGIMEEYRDTFYLSPNVTQYVFLPVGAMLRYFYSDLVVNNGIHITSDLPIYVQAANKYKNRKGVSSVLPVTSIPYAPEYRVLTNEPTRYDSCLGHAGWLPNTCSEYIIVGIAEKSIIEILNTSPSVWPESDSHKPITITLMKGETYFYIGTAKNKVRKDLSGTIIRSKTLTSRFAVFAGNKSGGSTLQNRNNQNCSVGTDHVYEQMIPLESWGNSYTAMPFRNNPGGYFIKVLAANDNTEVKINGVYHSTLGASRYFVWNVNSDTVTSITANRSISVVQFTKTRGCNEFQSPKQELGNLSMISLIADGHYTNEAMVNHTSKVRNTWGSSGSPSAPEAYVNVLVNSADTANFLFDGKRIANSVWKKSSQTGNCHYAQLYIDSTCHRLSSDKGFISYVYGYAPREGFSYTSGGRVSAVNPNFIYNRSCKFDTTVFQATHADSFYNFKWKFGNETTFRYGKTTIYYYKDTGYFNVMLYMNHIRTNAYDSVMKKLYITIADKTPVLCNDTLICGTLGFALIPRKFQFFKSYLWNGGHPWLAQWIKNPGLYWVEVTERNGCSYRDSTYISNTPNPEAIYAMSDTAVCSNVNYPIYFANLSTSAVDPIVNTHWDFDDFNPIDTTMETVTHLFPKVGQHYIKMRVTTDKGCYDDTFAVVEILKAPEADFLVLDKDSCFSSNQVTFQNITVTDSLHFWYKWIFSEGYIISNSDPAGPRHYDTSGLFTASLIYENNNTCVDTMTKQIHIYSDPVADFEFSPAVPCNGDSVQFINKTVSEYKPLLSNWQFGDLSGSSDSVPVHRYAGKGRYITTLIVLSPQACRDTISKEVFINGATQASFSIDDTAQCLDNNRFKLSNTSVTDSGYFTVSDWRFSDGSTIGGSFDLNKTFLQSGVQVITLKVANNFGCSDSISRQVFVYNSPSGNILVNDPNQCENDQDFDFSFGTAAGNDSIHSFRWYYPGDSSIGPDKLSDLAFMNPGIYPVQLKFSSIHGCKGEITRYVSVNPGPIADFTLSSYEKCLKDKPLTFNNTSTINSGGIAAYQWDFGDGGNSTLQFPHPKTYSDTGYYRILLSIVSDSGCRDTAMAGIRIKPNAVVQIMPVLPVCLNDSTAFSAIVSVPGGSISSMRWEFGDQNSSTLKDCRHLYTSPGIYPVKLVTSTNQNCIDTTKINAVVLKLPEVSFRYNFLDGGNERTRVNFYNTSPSASSQQWQFGTLGGSRKDTSLLFSDSLTLKVNLTISDQNGCSNSKEEFIFIGGKLKFYMPNVFTPNGDGHNDGFGPVGIYFANQYTFTIYNRWGEIVFRTDNPAQLWDGTYQNELCPNGIYIYTIELRDFFWRYQNFDGSVLLKW